MMRTRPASVEETGPAFARVKGDDTMADDRGVFEGKEVAAASAGILAKCDQRGMVMPFILVSVSRNGSVQVVQRAPAVGACRNVEFLFKQ